LEKEKGDNMSEKWIPVADGLPEQAGYYWITIRGNINTECRMVERTHFDTDFGWNCSCEVVAWMTQQHKPKPYRGDVQETQHRQKTVDAKIVALQKQNERLKTRVDRQYMAIAELREQCKNTRRLARGILIGLLLSGIINTILVFV
jgi:hypothetical protein